MMLDPEDPPMIDLPRPTPEMVKTYLREAMPIATEQEIISRMSEVLMTDALGRAIHHGRTPGGLLNMPKCTRVNRRGAVEDVPYGYDDPAKPEYLCTCEQIAGGLITMMKLLDMAEQHAHPHIVLPPGYSN